VTDPDRTALAGPADYVAAPVPTSDRPGPWPGVVLVHDVLGLGDDMREQADWLAAAGYLVAVPDLYEGRLALRCLTTTFRQLTRRRGPVFDRLDAVRSALAVDPRCTGRVGVIGYCMGGGFALLLAGRPGWSVAGVNYGPVPDDVDEVLRDACPVVASFGGRDKGFAGAAERLRTAADAAGVPADVKEYPDARHGFINRISVASPLTPLLKVAGVGYDHDAAADAKRRILRFFDEHLRVAVDPG
jgi:carboxymethylenebutenolidase